MWICVNSSVSRVIINIHPKNKLDKIPMWTKADNSPIIVTISNLKSTLPFLNTDYTHSPFKSTTTAINKPHMAPSVAKLLIETSGDNFLEEQSEWCWAGMQITSNPKPGLCWRESWTLVTFRVLHGPSVVLSHIGLSLMSTGGFSHGPASQDSTGREERWGWRATWGEVRPQQSIPTAQLVLHPLRHL